MFIEIAEYVRCVSCDADTFCVVTPERMEQRCVVTGVIGCPACHAEYEIVDAVAQFGAPAGPALRREFDPEDASNIRALLGLETPGGCVVLIGDAVGLVPALAVVMDGVHFIGINGPSDVEPDQRLSLFRTAQRVPLSTSMARGVVLGENAIEGGFASEAVRILLNGQRLVAMNSGGIEPDGIEPMAAGKGLWVGRRKGRYIRLQSDS